MPPKIDWENDPEHIELMKYLIERTKNAKSPLGINALAREFKEKSGSFQTVPCFNFRIQKLRERVAVLDTIDTETKVKMMFALSVSIDKNFLNELRKDADVEIDEKNRITEYKANDGSFELKGDHSHSARNKDGWKHRKRESQGYFVDIFQDSMSTTPGSMKRFAPDDSEEILEYPEIQSLRQPELLGAKDHKRKKRSNNGKNDAELMNFLIERISNAKSPLSISQLAREFKEKSGCSQAIPSLTERIRQLRGKIAESDTIDATTKVRIIFALSAPIDTSYLKELQNIADVEIDANNRITKYREKYGNFILEGDHSASAKHKRVGKMDPIDTETKVKMIVAMGVSVDEHLLNELRTKAHVEVDGNNRITKYRAKDGSLELNGDHSPSAKMKDGWKHKRMEIQKYSILKTPLKRSAEETPNFLKFARIGVVKSENPEIRQPKLEVTAPIKTEPGRAEEAPILKNGGAPRALGAPGADIPQGAPNDAYTPQIKLLEAIQSLILTLEMPSLSPLQEKIDKKLRESSPNAMIRNDEMSRAITVLFAKITGNSMPIQPENVKSVGLKELLCYLKAAIFNSKLEGLEGLLVEIRGRIEELASEDKKISAEKVASALQATLDVIGL